MTMDLTPVDADWIQRLTEVSLTTAGIELPFHTVDLYMNMMEFGRGALCTSVSEYYYISECMWMDRVNHTPLSLPETDLTEFSAGYLEYIYWCADHSDALFTQSLDSDTAPEPGQRDIWS